LGEPPSGNLPVADAISPHSARDILLFLLGFSYIYGGDSTEKCLRMEPTPIAGAVLGQEHAATL
jgi:hypothetical protein